jgi:hypothetical protein
MIDLIFIGFIAALFLFAVCEVWLLVVKAKFYHDDSQSSYHISSIASGRYADLLVELKELKEHQMKIESKLIAIDFELKNIKNKNENN